MSYAQITQKKKEEREAKEAADRAAAAAAAHNLNHGPVDGASAVDPSTKKIVKDQVAVKQNLHGMIYIFAKFIYSMPNRFDKLISLSQVIQ